MGVFPIPKKAASKAPLWCSVGPQRLEHRPALFMRSHGDMGAEG